MTTNEYATELIKNTFRDNNINVKHIKLFGSRAKGYYNEKSDWDYLVIIDKDLDFKEKWKIVKQIKRKLAIKKIPNDIIIRSQQNFEKDKINKGSIVYYANKESITA